MTNEEMLKEFCRLTTKMAPMSPARLQRNPEVLTQWATLRSEILKIMQDGMLFQVSQEVKNLTSEEVTERMKKITKLEQQQKEENNQ
jgi:hypothetical protein